MTDDNVFLGVAVTCGLQKVIIPFFDRGLPAEYELVRALCSVTQQKRKKVGILQTDAQLFGGSTTSRCPPATTGRSSTT